MKYFITAIVLAFALFSEAANLKTTPQQYLAQYKDAAIKEMNRSGVPASITLAQGMLESAYGNSKLARKAKNHFGIKCHSDWNGPSVRKDDDAKNECFRKYSNVSESYRDHSNFLTGKSRYAFLFEYKITDYKAWAKGLKKAGYATNPKYPKLLIDLIERYELDRFDSKKGRKEKAQEDSVRKTGRGKVNEQPIDQVQIKSRIQVSDNFVKYIIVRRGDDLKSIAKEFNVRTKRILKYNERRRKKVYLGEKIYLQPKKKNARTKYHKVKRGETLYSVSQEFGVTIKSIKKRNRMGTSETIKRGQKLKLRGRKIKL
jgi:LysM repeat protein